VAAHLEREADRILSSELGLSTTTYALLSTLGGQEHHLTQQGIAELLGVTKSSISRHMDAATAHGYLTPSSSPISRRDRAVELTPKGRQVLARADALVEAVLPGAATDADVATATRGLTAVAARLKR
jgi:DNA-binding MarR family transcriptional regulator